jgi:GMP synthase-like glutamine amidotransferase
MKIGILETGQPPGPLIARFGRYPAMFERLLAAPGRRFESFDVAAGAFPARPEACDAYVVTGSPAGVYDDLPWIDPLKGFLVAARGRAALVGVCFGHQVMAEAFGGKVVKSDRGWGVGLHTYQVCERLPWMDGAAAIAVPASHQDQVVEAPPGARVAAASDFSPFGALDYGDARAFSIQLHPEFDADFAKALAEARRGRLGEARTDAAVASLDAPNDNARVGRWIGRFLEGSTSSSSGAGA